MKPRISDLPLKARSLTAIGDLTAAALDGLYHFTQEDLFGHELPFDIEPLISAFLSPQWSDEEASSVISQFNEHHRSGKVIETKALARWIRSHFDDSHAVAECMTVNPPNDIEIARMMPQTGSQKRVFLATWLPKR